MKDVMKEFTICHPYRTQPATAQLYSRTDPAVGFQKAECPDPPLLPACCRQTHASGYRDKCRVYSPLVVVQVIVNALGSRNSMAEKSTTYMEHDLSMVR